MNINPARILPELPRWVASCARDAVGAKMTVTFRGQAGELSRLRSLATNHENPSTNSDCGAPLAAKAGQERTNFPVAASALPILKTGVGIAAQRLLYVLRRFTSKGVQIPPWVERGTLQTFAVHSSLLRSGYPARWLAFRQILIKPLEFCQVGYSFSAVQVVKQSLRRLSKAFRLSCQGTPAEVLDVDNVAYGDFPFITASACEQINTQRSQGVGKVSQGFGKSSQGRNINE